MANFKTRRKLLFVKNYLTCFNAINFGFRENYIDFFYYVQKTNCNKFYNYVLSFEVTDIHHGSSTEIINAVTIPSPKIAEALECLHFLQYVGEV